MGPRALSEGIDHLLALLEKLQPPGDERVEWNITDLRLGSYDVDLRGRADVTAIATRGLDELADHPGVPRGWTLDAARQVLELGKIRKTRGVEDVQIELSKTLATIDETLLHNGERSLEHWPDSIGSIQGRLFRYNDLKHKAGVTDEVTLKNVDIKVPTEFRREVAGAVTYGVSVWGVMHHPSDGQVSQIAVEGIECAGGC